MGYSKTKAAIFAALVLVFPNKEALASDREGALGHFPLGEPDWSGAGGDSPPTWSRDGNRVLFQRTRAEGFAQIWSIRPDGTGLHRVTDGKSAAGHPDACGRDDRIAMVAVGPDGRRQVFQVNVDGSDRAALTTGGAHKAWPVYSPDCRSIVLVEISDPDSGHFDLKLLDVPSRTVRTLLSRVRYLGWPTWSADGQWVLFHREIEGHPNHIWRVHRDGTRAAPLSGGDHGDYWAPHMSDDGRRLSFAYAARDQLQWVGNADVWIMDRDTQACTRVRGERWHEHGQRLSPDGRWLAYWDDRDGYNEIHVLDLEDSGRSRQLSNQPEDELTGAIRRLGIESALARADRRSDSAPPYAERAMAVLLERRADQGRAPALELARRFVADYPESQRARAALFRERFRAGQWVQARTDYLQVLQGSPANTDALVRLGFLNALERLTAQDLATLESAAPEATVNGLGYALLRGGHHRSAIDVLRWNALQDPDSWNARDSLGEALYWYDQAEAAREAYARSLRANSENANARRFLDRINEGPLATGVSIPCPRWPDSAVGAAAE